MSKLDILARYAAPQKKTKKGTKPLKTALIVVDDNEEDVVLSSEAVEDRWDRDLTEDAPVVEDVSRGYSRKGDWESVEVRAVAEPSPPRRRKLSDASDSPPRRRAAPLSISAPVRKMDEDSSPRRRQEDESPPRRPQSSPSPPRRKRFEAPSQPINAGSSSPPRNPKEVAKEKVDGGRLTMTASGHAAGLQSGERFGETERSIKSLRDVELASADPEKSGGKAETVYRDRSGKKVDALDNFMRKQAAKEGKEAKLLQAQQEWGRGTVQKNERTERQRELEEMAAEPFARTIDDPKLEAMRREVIRDEDPMAEYMRQKKNKEVRGVQTQSGAKPSKPRYQGPVAPPNRFGIPPGYRWDAINRGNDFEHRVLLQKGQKSSLREDEHRWSTADM